MVARKHESIATALAGEIRAGCFDAGGRLPGEAALARRFSVSRNTVRSALAELSDEGLIATHSGKGSYVLYDGNRLAAEQGWGHALAAQGVDAMVRVLRIVLEQAPDLAILGLDPADAVCIERLRVLRSGPAISYERSRVPTLGGLAMLPHDGLVEASLTATLAAAGLRAHHGRARVSARGLTRAESRVLSRTPGEVFLDVHRTSFDASGQLVEDLHSLLDPDHFQISLAFVTGS